VPLLPVLRNIGNILGNSFKRHNFRVMLDKVGARFRERKWKSESARSLAWCRENVQPLEAFLRRVDSDLWDETSQVCREIESDAQRKLAEIDVPLGGGGNYPLLYFFTRLRRPATVVETGVAAGWSSQAILTALRNNGDNGRLYSSDFPYFRQQDPERFIGYVVADELRESWSLLIDGDKFNLPRILLSCGAVDLFHYDSDKSRAGRQFALDCLVPRIADNALLIFDDIQDNLHFADLVAERAWPYCVFEFEGKYIGMTGPGAGAYCSE
jgi:predicted O-methyltransferase YrrM